MRVEPAAIEGQHTPTTFTLSRRPEPERSELLAIVPQVDDDCPALK